MKEIDRSLLTIRAKEPFLDWLDSLLDPHPVRYTLDGINRDQSAYLLPEYEDDNQMEYLLPFFSIGLDKMVLEFWF